MYGIRGFTLIELLIVIGIIGVLAAVVIVGIDPVDKIAAANDTKLKRNIGVLANALLSYRIYTIYPTEVRGAWMSDLVSVGELRTVLTNSDPRQCLQTAEGGTIHMSQNNLCLKAISDGSEGIIFAKTNSKAEVGKCPGMVAWYVFSTKLGGSGTACTGSNETEPPVNLTSFNAN